jgi:hypothetical protein
MGHFPTEKPLTERKLYNALGTGIAPFRGPYLAYIDNTTLLNLDLSTAYTLSAFTGKVLGKTPLGREFYQFAFSPLGTHFIGYGDDPETAIPVALSYSILIP